ncbi:accessory Sec system protein Asp2 [Halobacillus litoralis]|uniref:accessory Sec system protein Asp2 n=1 Tax=Halobacillus litoralis TaxID=45668 RepID=UPI001CFD3332|nr:hypothetical protein [Halobacillus litoralis]
MSLSNFIFKNQYIHKGSTEVKYFYWAPETESNHLIVTFSGFNGKEEHGEPAYYNYVRQLEDTDCHRLFILDNYDGHPCYYLGAESKLDYESSVISIISQVANGNSIPLENIILAGSSKGGTAAVYFGLKYNYGHIIAGGMQTKVGDYLYELSPYTRYVVLRLITGGYDSDARERLNNHYRELFLNFKGQSKISLHIGKGDHHYKNHLLPFTNILDDRGIDYSLDVGDYSEHSGLAKHFGPFLIKEVNSILGLPVAPLGRE